MKSQAVLKEKSGVKTEILLKGRDRTEGERIAVHLLMGLLTGFFPEEYIVSPFCAAAVGASGEYAFATFLGGCMGYIISRGPIGALRYILMLCVVMLSVSLLTKKFRTLNPLSISIGFSTATVFAFDIAYALLGGLTVSGVVFAVADAMLCAGGVYFFCRSYNTVFSGAGFGNLTRIDAFSLAITGAAILCSISFVKIMNISPAHIFAAFIVLFSAHYKKSSGGSIMGVLLGSVLSINGDIHLLYVYALGGLVLGIMSPLGQYVQAVVFVLISGAVCLIMEGDINSLYTVIETAIACVSFVAIPSKLMNRLYDYFEKSGMNTDSQVNKQVAFSLRSAAETVNEIADIVSQVSEQLDGMINPEISKIYARIQQSVCTDCEHKSFCWNDNFGNTVRDIETIALFRLEGRGSVPDKLPYSLETRCHKLRLLSDCVDASYADYLNNEDYRLKIDEMRSIVTDQFSSMSMLLLDISSQLSGSRVYNENKSRAIKLALCESGIIVHNSVYYENGSSGSVVEVGVYEEPGKINHKKIQRIVSQVTQNSYRQTEVAIVDFVTVLTFRQRPRYEVIWGFNQIAKGNNRLCGDRIEALDDTAGNTVIILSDGMGTGKRAAIDAAMTSSLMHRLLGSGFTFESALRLVNSALLIKSQDESLSTIDTVSINTFSGVCDFYKAGAATSFIRHKDEVARVIQSSMPVGILRDTDYSHSVAKLEKGDIVLMVSDGVTAEDDGWIEDELLSWSTDNMQELATHIADMARLKSLADVADDITAIAMKVKMR